MISSFLQKLLFGFLTFLCGAYTLGAAVLIVASPFMEEDSAAAMISAVVMTLFFGWLTRKCWNAYRKTARKDSAQQQEQMENREGLSPQTRLKIKVGISLAAAGCGVVMVLKGSESQVEAGAPLILFGLVFAIGFIWSHRKKIAQEKREQARAALQARMEEVRALTELPVVEPRSVLLHPGEVCHYQAYASVLQIKNKVVGYTSGSGGVSVRVAKGVTLHSGNSRGHAIRQEVPQLYSGLFTITDQRFIMTGEKGFERPFSKLTALDLYNGIEGVTLQFGRSSYTVLMEEPFWVPKIIELLQRKSAAKIQRMQAVE